jgi:hypothetical protein
MTIHLDHTIVPSRTKVASAKLLARPNDRELTAQAATFGRR